MNNSKWFYCFNSDCGDCFSELECEIKENPSYEELNAIAQELLRDYGYTSEFDYVSIGKGELITIEDLGGCLGNEIIEMLENKAIDCYDCEELFSGVSREDIKDLDSRIKQALKEWAKERKGAMSCYYTIPDPECFYYHEDKDNEEEQK